MRKTLLLIGLVCAGWVPASALADTLRFRVATLRLAEDAGVARLEVIREAATDTPCSVEFLTVEQTAKEGSDFRGAGGTLDFVPGQTSAIIEVSLINDGRRVTPATRYFDVLLTNASAGIVVGAPSSARVYVSENDPGLQIEFANYWASEGSGAAHVGVTRGPDEAGATAQVTLRTANQTARSGTDFVGQTNQVSFAAGETLKLVPIALVNDGLAEGSKTFGVSVVEPVDATLGTRTSATVTILDNDPGLEFARVKVWAHEDQGAVRLTLNRGNDGALDAFDLRLTITNGTARLDEDFLLPEPVVTFAAGETQKIVRLPLVLDGEEESDETFQVAFEPVGERLPPLGRAASRVVTVTICDAGGLTTSGFAGGAYRTGEGVEFGLVGGVAKRFRDYFRIFRIDYGQELGDWNGSLLVGRPGNAGESSAWMPGHHGGLKVAREFYRIDPGFLITPSPAPTGPYPVGLMQRLISDPARRNRYRVSTNTSFMISIWYPCVATPGMRLAPFDDPPYADDVAFQTTAFMDRAPRFSSFSLLDAPVRRAGERYPIVLYSHGGGVVRNDNQDLAQNLASHGYVVVAADHYDAWFTVFPDGTTYPYAENGMGQISVASLQDRVRDLCVVLDRLSEFNASDPGFAGMLDLEHVASMGWSFGAESAGELCRTDDRCDVAVSTDWGYAVESTAPELMARGLQKPSLMLNSSEHTREGLFAKAVTDAYLLQITGTLHAEFSSYGWQFKPRDLAATREAARTIHAYTLSFLNKYLRDRDDHLLDGPSPDYPRVGIFRRK